MLDTGYLYAKDKNRIFINTCLGCNGGCAYCYLPKMGYNNNEQSLKIRSANQILADIKNSSYSIDENTLITLGCFSECWDEQNKPQTIELIKYFLSQGNYVQLSTKKQITLDEVMQFKELIQYLGQFVIFVVLQVLANGKNLKEILITLQIVLGHLRFLINLIYQLFYI